MQDLDRRRDLVEQRLVEVLDAVEPPVLADRSSDVVLAGGKRVRPTLVMLVCELLGGESDDALDYAAGVELVHNASLVVDDIIDESELRRGSPSAWAATGHGPALITSDGLLGEALALFADDPRAMETITESVVDLGAGEATELMASPSDEAAYLELARRKTGALFRAAAELGAIAVDASPETTDAAGTYAERVGVAFQIRDDVLDATGDRSLLGKPAGQDADLDRPSVLEVTDLSAAEATDRAREERDRALAALDSIDAADPAALEYLRDLASFAVERER
ncbi:polyprenyl synthetase family protein [Halococcoides cellulosivorans]|uniref:Isopentenyl pyrophosphate isomerase n=1 Tax=Halococcoides cellulosivorans TaxID=1679096 RepID=A0A2R4X2K1_9EURY|nr:polyprenyl synthetase family protein [Halococcoides cellulosivorans]AWB28030.1 isopentenyl pyrophosphate isomerase [Halococcoides cellulosivorans]